MQPEIIIVALQKRWLAHFMGKRDRPTVFVAFQKLAEAGREAATSWCFRATCDGSWRSKSNAGVFSDATCRRIFSQNILPPYLTLQTRA